MKNCCRCGTSKPVKEFYKNSRAKDGLTAFCKACERSRQKATYQNDEVARQNKIRLAQEARAKRREYIWNYLRSHPCVDCGISDIRVLEFDHVRGDKVIGVTRAMQYSWDILLAEIPKCDIRCANCHRIKTYTQLGWNIPESN